MNIRQSVLWEVELLSQPSMQLDYERSLTLAGHAPSELVSVFCDDLYHPKAPAFIDAFTEDELKDLAHLYGLVVEASTSDYSTVGQMLKDVKWRRVVAVAKELVPRLKSGDG
jgi:hypothetical protein